MIILFLEVEHVWYGYCVCAILKIKLNGMVDQSRNHKYMNATSILVLTGLKVIMNVKRPQKGLQVKEVF